MTLMKTDRIHRYAPLSRKEAPSPVLDVAALVAIAAAPGLLLLWLVPLTFFMPALSIASFVIACGMGLFAHYSRIDLRTPGITPWDIAGIFTLMWIGAAMVAGPRRIIELFAQLTLAA